MADNWIAWHPALWALALAGAGLYVRRGLRRRRRTIASMLRPDAVCAERASR